MNPQANPQTHPETSRCVPDRWDTKIQRRTEADLGFYAEHPELIPERLAKLDRECDIERAFATTSAGLSLGGLTLGFLRGYRWFLLPLALQGFTLQYAVQGWTQPLSLLRRLGLRTRQEIDHEREVLLTLLDDATDPSYEETYEGAYERTVTSGSDPRVGQEAP